MVIEKNSEKPKPRPQSLEDDCLPLKILFKTGSQKNVSEEVCQEPIFIHLLVFCEYSLRKFFRVVLLGKGERDLNCGGRHSLDYEVFFA